MAYAPLGSAISGGVTWNAGAGTASCSVVYSGTESVIVVGASWGFGARTGVTCTDGTNTYVYIGQTAAQADGWYCHAPAAGTFTLLLDSATGQYGTIAVDRFTGITGAPIGFVGGSDTGFAEGAVPDNISAGAINITTQPALVYQVAQQQNDANPPTAGTGFTSLGTMPASSGGVNGIRQHRRATATGNTTPALTTTEIFETFEVFAVAFAEVAGDPPQAQRVKPSKARTPRRPRGFPSGSESFGLDTVFSGNLFDPALYFPQAAGGASAPVGRADETDAAFACGSARPAGLSAETDTALARTAIQIRATGLSSEADSALALAALQVRATGLAAEADTALPLGSARPAGLAAETDSALALAGVQRRAAGLASETDAALQLGVARPAGLAAETDAALALGAVHQRAVGRAEEVDAGLALAVFSGSAVGLAAEADTAFARGAVQIRTTGLAVESDAALSLAGVQLRAAGRADEVDTPLALAPVQRSAAGLALEIDTALALSSPVATVGLATETDTAFALSAVVAGAGQGFGSYAPRRRNKRVLQQERDRILARNAPQPAPPPPVFDPGPVIINVPRHVVAAPPAPPKPTVQYVLFKHEVERDVFVYLPRAEPLQQPEPPKVVPKKPPPKLAAPPALMRSHGLTLMRTATK